MFNILSSLDMAKAKRLKNATADSDSIVLSVSI